MSGFLSAALAMGLTMASPLVPQPVAAHQDRVVAIDAGRRHTCAVTAAGKVWCWGWNIRGQLGDATWADSNVPVQVKGLSDATAIATGKYHSCAITRSGSAWCWGSNDHGELGDGSQDESGIPVQVAGLTGASAITVGLNYSCALDQAGTAWCWGANESGQQGNGTEKGSLAPVRVRVDEKLTSISAAFSKNHTCARDQAGRAWCWGLNNYGQLGTGHFGSSSSPKRVVGLPAIRSVTTGGYGHSCAIGIGWEAWCWGTNYWGQLGSRGQMGSAGKFTQPVRVKNLVGLRSLALGSGHTCAIDSVWRAWCWGYNGNGDLGDGTTINRATAVRVASLPKVSTIATGLGHTCALAKTGQVYCWGWGGFGQLGHGHNVITQPVPVEVSFPTKGDLPASTHPALTNAPTSGPKV